jgi:hypothetical protein
MPPKKNVERKRGNRVGFWFFRAAARAFGLRGAYGLLYFVSLYYLLFDHAGFPRAWRMSGVASDHGFRRMVDVYCCS